MKNLSVKALVIIFLMITFYLSLFADVPDLKVPELFNPIQDQYSKNYLNASMAARGNTGIAIPDGINSAIYNPAAFRSDENHFSFELLIKDVEKEFNTYNSTSRPRKEYHSPSALGFFGIGLSSYNNFHTGLSYSLVRSIEYNSFLRSLYGTGIVDTYPSYNEHQFTLTFNKQLGYLSVGLNNNIVIQSFTDYKNEGRVDKVDLSEAKYIPQVGILYEGNILSLGGSYKPKVKNTLQEKYISFDSVHPTTLSSGISLIPLQDIRFSFDMDYTRYSEVSDYFDDQVSLKFGLEKLYKAFNFKIGFMHLPSVYEGEYLVYDYRGNDVSSFHPEFFNEIPQKGFYGDTTQNILTFGTTVNLFKTAKLSLAYLTDMSSNTNQTQFLCGLEIEFSALKKVK